MQDSLCMLSPYLECISNPILSLITNLAYRLLYFAGWELDKGGVKGYGAQDLGFEGPRVHHNDEWRLMAVNHG